MKVAGTRDGRNHEEEADSGIERRAGDLVEEDLAQGADKGEDVANKVELGDLSHGG